ncbi:hypothetical protein F5X71_09815 [Nocardia brasiliensis]|uniref:Uncharacterized protein n=1 Tax=Nocardia brasiliensis TaxID=37326 RepID=A0A6G9XNU5_NOCBR|nr:hypothetical protein [Nocardia brasiliensis]QIS02578.1 hypothetical protein F5X71_09815 [Nocardia brasiliensis]
MTLALLVALSVFLGGIALASGLFGVFWAFFKMLDRSGEVTVFDIQRRLSHERPIQPLTVEDALTEEPNHRECSVARCHKKRAINRALAAQRRDARSSAGRIPPTHVSPIERWSEWPSKSS